MFGDIDRLSLDMRFSHTSGFGIKKRYCFGHRSRLIRSRPGFMEPMPLGAPGGAPPDDGGAGGGAGGGLRMRRTASSSSRSSSFSIKDDAGYIGYLTDDESGSGSGGDVLNVVCRRRRELLGNDMSFSDCLTLCIMVGVLLMLFIFAWGVPPPNGGKLRSID